MQTIRLTTLIDAPPQRCFLLALSIELQMHSVGKNGDRAIAGRTSGLIRAGETVTWSGRHFGLRVKHTSRIDLWRPYFYFRDVMVEGTLAQFEHHHHFASMDDGTRMRDEVRFTAPAGLLGRLVEGRLRRHVAALQKRRNATIKQVAESEEWHRYLDNEPPVDLSHYPASG